MAMGLICRTAEKDGLSQAAIIQVLEQSLENGGVIEASFNSFATYGASIPLSKGVAKACNNSFIRGIRSNTASKVLLIPPDTTRAHSYAGEITAMYYKMLTQAGVHVDILPALGTHAPLSRAEQLDFFGDIPSERFRTHRWRDGVTSIGKIPAAATCQISQGIMDKDIPVEVSDYILDPSYDIIISIGQVVPHEVVGMANYTKNIVVGCGGSEFINASHMLGAAYGIERTMGQINTPVRRLFDYAETHFLSELPFIYVLTVTETVEENTIVKGLFIGSGPNRRKAFEEAARLSQECNIIYVDKPLETCVVYLNAKEFHSLWLGNKAIYRTRMAMADGGRLIVCAPGVKAFAEDPVNDRLIRKYGYTGRDNILHMCKTDKELQANLSAAAHLIHGSPDGRFEVVYAAPLLGEEAIKNVGYKYMELEEAMGLYDQCRNTDVYAISNPALGLWSARRFIC